MEPKTYPINEQPFNTGERIIYPPGAELPKDARGWTICQVTTKAAYSFIEAKSCPSAMLDHNLLRASAEKATTRIEAADLLKLVGRDLGRHHTIEDARALYRVLQFEVYWPWRSETQEAHDAMIASFHRSAAWRRLQLTIPVGCKCCTFLETRG